MAARPAPDLPPQDSRPFGAYELRRLLGESRATSVWLAFDRRSRTERLLTLPRVAPPDASARARWIERTRHAARLDHPNLVAVAEVGVHEGCPFVATERGTRLTLAERLAGPTRPTAAEVASWLADALRGLAYAHEAGIVHGDPQLQHVLVDDRGTASVMALGAADIAARAGDGLVGRGLAVDASLLRDRRLLAERDVLAVGVLLHHLLSGEAPLGVGDTGRVIERLAPQGRENLRLPWSTPLPVPEALRAIANRATASQERLRYRGARTLQGALANWLAADAQASGGPIALLLDRLHTVGHLPALPGLAARVARVTSLEGQRTDEIARQILPDMALSLELLRTLNSAQVQGTQVQGNGPVLTLRRVVALIGVDGVRKAANTLRPWPGSLDEGAAAQLKRTMERVRLAGHLAQALRPAGYDPEVVFLIAVMQNLGRVLVRYHFADEAEQIEQLMRPTDGTPAGDAAVLDSPGMSEETAAFAVLGVDVAACGHAVARQWRLGDEIEHMIRRLPPETPVRKPDNDAELLRLLASAANEAVDAVSLLPARRVGGALERVAERYARVLRLTPRNLHDALHHARDALKQAAALPPRQRRDESGEPTAPAELA